MGNSDRALKELGAIPKGTGMQGSILHGDTSYRICSGSRCGQSRASKACFMARYAL